jgi:hypothetical protein
MDLVVRKVRSSWVTLMCNNCYSCSLISASVDIPASCKKISVRHTAKVSRASLTPLWWTGSRVFSVVSDADL